LLILYFDGLLGPGFRLGGGPARGGEIKHLAAGAPLTEFQENKGPECKTLAFGWKNI
jgi:hypothetical protein